MISKLEELKAARKAADAAYDAYVTAYADAIYAAEINYADAAAACAAYVTPVTHNTRQG